MPSKFFRKALASVSPESRRFTQKNLAITEQIVTILKQKGMTQRELAKALGKSEPEVSRMLSGLHNLTLKTIAKLEVALDADIILTPIQSAERNFPIKSKAKVVAFTSVGLQNQQGGKWHMAGETSHAMASFHKESVYTLNLIDFLPDECRTTLPKLLASDCISAC